MSKAIPYDEDDSPRVTRYKKIRPVNKSMFKLRDPKTGLFWGVSDTKNPRFNNIGKNWSTRGSVMRNWAEYKYRRLVLSDDQPELELVEFEVTTVEKKVGGECVIDYSTAAKIEAVLGKNQTFSVVNFLRKISSDSRFTAKHVIEASGGTELEMPLPIPASMKIKANLSNMTSFSSGPTHHLLIAAQNDADMLYLKMTFGDNIVAIYDINEIIAQYDSGIRAKEGKF